jgi:hypothetical protein
VAPPRPAAQQASRAPAAPAVTSAAADAAPQDLTDGLLPGWEPVFSRSKQTWYFKHKASGETSWTKPTAEAKKEGAKESRKPVVAPEAGVWVEAMSKSKGVPYWRNSVTGVTTWTDPNK